MIALAAACSAARCCGQKSIFLVLDGSSLTLTDTAEEKGFGSIGSRGKGARGLKVMNALALGPSGQTIGILAQQYWARGERAKKGYRPLKSRESHRWHQAFDTAHAALREYAPKAKLHVLGDREADAALFMRHLLRNGSAFTIRANGNRKVKVGDRCVGVRWLMRRQLVLARHTVAVPGNGHRLARIATLAIRAAEVTLLLRDHHISEPFERKVTVVWALK